MKRIILFLTVILVAGLILPAFPAAAGESENASMTARLEADLFSLSASPRPIGSEAEQQTAVWLETRFESMGYRVSTQEYVNDAGQIGTNVIAAKPAAGESGDILVISSHHDSVPTSCGASDNASGVAVLLAVAEAMQDIQTDTELRFISFTDEENGKNGSRFYLASLPEQERERIIGDIQLDMLGGLGSSGLTICTMDGSGNYLSDLLNPNGEIPMTPETASDHASFQLAEIPSVLITQDSRGYLYHSAADTPSQIDLEQLTRATELVCSALREVASPETPSYRALAKQQAQGYTFRQTRQTVIYFGSSLADSESYLGAAGVLDQQWEVSGNGWTDTYEAYRYPMRWFGGEAPMNTYYTYRNGFLDGIEIRPEETGYTLDQVQALIGSMYGAPAQEKTDDDGILTLGWADEIYSKYISLRLGSPCTVTVSSYSVGLSNVLASYPVEKGQAEIDSEADAQVWSFICSILPPEARQKIAEFNLFTDGCSNILAYTSPIRREDGTVDNSRFSINIDYYDVFDENGNPRDWSKLAYTVLHEYGHVLLEDETQIDLTLGTDTHDPAGFLPGSFRKAFYDRFWEPLGITAVSDYNENPTNYVSRYGANYFHEDIADTFAVFVLGEKPEGSTGAAEKLGFFWADEAMVALRTEIRSSMGLMGLN